MDWGEFQEPFEPFLEPGGSFGLQKALINGKYYTDEYDFFHTFTHFSKK